MTRQEWLTCAEPAKMLSFLGDTASERKLRLFCVGCCRRYWVLLDDEYGQLAVEGAEGCADALLSVDALSAWWNIDRLSDNYAVHESIAKQLRVADSLVSGAFGTVGRMMGVMGWQQATDCCSSAAELARNFGWASRAGDLTFTGYADEYRDPNNSFVLAEKAVHTALLRDIFGNPFRSVSVDPDWLTSTVVSLAQQMYESRDFSTMPILADALQDAGCTIDDILNHCRSDGPHVRGCWVVDLVLGKS